MAKSIDIFVANGWVNLNLASGIAAGTVVALQNKGEYDALIQESDDEPLTATEGKIITVVGGGASEAYYDESSLTLRAYCSSPNGTIINIQA